MTRTLFFTAPMLHGADVKRFQFLANHNKYGHFYDGDEDGYFGEMSRNAAWKARKMLGYPDTGSNTWKNPVAGPRLIQFLEGTLKLPLAYAKRRDARLKAMRSMARPLPTPLGPGSEFTYVDAEGAPDNNGVRHHAGKDWFAPGGTKVSSPVNGTVVEARHSSDTSGQVFGGTVKIQGPKYVHVFRHVFPLGSIGEGSMVYAGQVVATVTRWSDWPEGSHAHCEIWKTFAGGYDYENMIDPVTIYKDAV